MKNTQKIQFILTPIYICILSVMLIVVSFSWYKVSSSSANIQTESSDVSITAEAPKGIDVQLTPIGDVYSLSEDGTTTTYTVVSKVDANDNTKVLLTGYFGQYGNEKEPSLDKPYIAFYKATITTTKDLIDVNSAFIKKSEIQKVNIDDEGNKTNDGDPVIKEVTDASTSPYSINFYTKIGDPTVDEKDATISRYTFTSESSTFNPSGTTQDVYIGIKFYPTEKNENTCVVKTDGGKTNYYFLYSDIEYYGSTYKLTACFTNSGSSTN